MDVIQCGAAGSTREALPERVALRVAGMTERVLLALQRKTRRGRCSATQQSCARLKKTSARAPPDRRTRSEENCSRARDKVPPPALKTLRGSSASQKLVIRCRPPPSVTRRRL